jgi:two-component system sensor histidine kinase KdpD
MTLAAPDGEPIPVLLNAVRAAGPDGPEGPTYDALLVRIRARSRWEAELLESTRAMEQERAASQRLAAELAARQVEEERNREFRDAFIGVVSHELRTPITTIYGMSNVLRQRHGTMDPATVGRHLEDIAVESDRLRRLTEDLLVLSQAEGGRLQVAADPVIVGHVIRTAVESERARSIGHTFTIDAPPQVPLVLGEELYVEQVLRNLLGNAAKYSPPGTKVAVSARSASGGVEVRVVDSGPGLPDGATEQLFNLFYRAPGAIQQTAGAGIGLFVCRELVRAMGGKVWAAPAASGTGAEFGFWLPAAEDEPDEG